MFENWDDEDFGFYDTDSDEETGTKVRDTVLESLLSKALKRVNVSASLAPVIGGSLDPLDLTKLTGSIQVQANNDYAEVDLNMDNITLTELSKVKVENLVVERKDNLEEMKILFNVKLDSFAARGRFDIVGRVWAMEWWPVDSQGEQDFSAVMDKIIVETAASVKVGSSDCKENGASVTDLNLVLHYQQVDFDLTNIDPELVHTMWSLALESLNELASSSLKDLMRQRISEFVC